MNSKSLTALIASIIILTGVSSIQNVFAPPCFDGRAISILEYSDFIEMIFVGKTVSKKVVDPDVIFPDYDVKFNVEKVLKGIHEEFVTIRTPLNKAM